MDNIEWKINIQILINHPQTSKENNQITFPREEYNLKNNIVKAWYDINENRQGEWKIAKGGNKLKLSRHSCDIN